MRKAVDGVYFASTRLLCQSIVLEHFCINWRLRVYSTGGTVDVDAPALWMMCVDYYDKLDYIH